MILAMTFAINY